MYQEMAPKYGTQLEAIKICNTENMEIVIYLQDPSLPSLIKQPCCIDVMYEQKVG